MENGPSIDGLPIKNGDFPWLCLKTRWCLESGHVFTHRGIRRACLGVLRFFGEVPSEKNATEMDNFPGLFLTIHHPFTTINHHENHCIKHH